MKYYGFELLTNGDVDLINPCGNSRVLIAGSNENEMFDIELDRYFGQGEFTLTDISSMVIDFYWYDHSTAWRTGYTDGFHQNDYDNTYTTGSQSWIDYDIGFDEGEHDNA
jgi:hypothetical protein